MKKTALILCLIAALLCFASCKKTESNENTQTEPAQVTETQEEAENLQDETADENSEAANETETAEGESVTSSENKLEHADYYGGPVKSISDDKLVITSDTTDEDVEFTLSEKAKKAIEHFAITEGTIVVVDFEVSEDGSKTATDIGVQKNNLD